MCAKYEQRGLLLAHVAGDFVSIEPTFFSQYRQRIGLSHRRTSRFSNGCVARDLRQPATLCHTVEMLAGGQLGDMTF